MEQRSAIPWCDRRRTYCASGCSIREKTSNSGACDWEARVAAAPVAVRVEVQPEARPPRAQEQQPRQQFQRNQQHPRARFNNGGRKGQGAPAKSADAAQASPPPAPVAAAADAVVPATVQSEMFSAPAAAAAVAQSVAVADSAPVAVESPSGND